MSRAYYNEFDRQKAPWLRELIKEKHIADGDVDERSIKDVTPGDIHGYTQCHFFAGIGVWSHALRRAGWADDREVWTGSCPCQSFSVAGKKKGFADERHLWPQWQRLISVCHPPVIFGEIYRKLPDMKGPIKEAIEAALAKPKKTAGRPLGRRDNINHHKKLRGAWSARATAEQLGIDPLAVLLDSAIQGKLPPVKRPNPNYRAGLDNGAEPFIWVERELSPEECSKNLRDAMRYLMPTISAVQHTGKDGGPIQSATIDLTAIMKDPDLARAAQTISLAVTAQQRALPAPEEVFQDPDPEVIDANPETGKED